jgi:protein phosphatase
MRIVPGNSRHLGSRKEQQDDFGFSYMGNPIFVRHGGVLAVVVDGMGGMAMGKEAGYAGKMTMLHEYQEKSVDESIPMALQRSLFTANAAVVSLASASGKENLVGTTLVAAVVHHGRLHWIAAGDSRIYLYRSRTLTQLTQDHVYGRVLDAQAAQGEISSEEAQSHPNRDALTSGLGWEPLEEVDQSDAPLTLVEGDRVLLCSDGIYKTLLESEMARMLFGHPQQAADALIQAALSKHRPSQDNMTAVILACDPDDPSGGTELSAPKNRRMKPLLLSLLAVFMLLMVLMAFVMYREVNIRSLMPLPEKPTPAVINPPALSPATYPPATGYKPPSATPEAPVDKVASIIAHSMRFQPLSL